MVYSKKIFKSTIFLNIVNGPINNPDISHEFIKKNKLDAFSYELFREKSLNYAEFSKILCISYGKIKYNIGDGTTTTFTKTIESNDEKEILVKFLDVCDKQVKKYGDIKFCGFNVEKNRIPLLIKRLLANGIKIPPYLNIVDLKPWEINVIDILKFWDLTSYASTSLDLIFLTLFPDKYEISSKNKVDVFDSYSIKDLIIETDEDLKRIIHIFIYLQELYEF